MTRRRMHNETHVLDPDDPGIAAAARNYDLFELRRANVLHLVDLKRAGHSPARTEFRIEPDRTIVRPIARELVTASPIGSSAGLCVDL